MRNNNEDDEDDIAPCDLECQLEGPYRAEARVIHEYVGPVKITMVDLLDVGFWPRVCGAAIIAIAIVYIGCTVSAMVLFSVTFKLPLSISLHIVLCAIGFQLLIPNGILMWNPLFGPASQLLPHKRLRQHLLIQLVAYILIFTGGFHVWYTNDSIPANPHTITGIMAFGGATFALLSGLLHHCCRITILKFPHSVCGLVTYIVSSISTCLVILSSSFTTWARRGLIEEIPYILAVICIVHTVLVMMSVKCRIRERNKRTLKYIVF